MKIIRIVMIGIFLLILTACQTGTQDKETILIGLTVDYLEGYNIEDASRLCSEICLENRVEDCTKHFEIVAEHVTGVTDITVSDTTISFLDSANDFYQGADKVYSVAFEAIITLDDNGTEYTETFSNDVVIVYINANYYVLGLLYDEEFFEE